MIEKEYDGFVVNKKFKAWLGNKDQNCSGIDKDEEQIYSNIDRIEREAGPYFLGPTVRKYVRAPVTQCLARKKGTQEFYLMKILDLDDEISSEKCSFVKRTIFHNECAILSVLKDTPGVIQICDFFREHVHLDNVEEGASPVFRRACLVLECMIPHKHYNAEFIQLHNFIKEDKMNEIEALYIFYNILSVINEMHKKNVVHRDIRLSNIILNRKNLTVKLIDFYYAKLLPKDNLFRKAKTQSSPNLQGGNSNLSPKANDMWSAGVILYAMLNGCMPFAGTSNYISFFTTNRSLHEFYSKILENDCALANNICISEGTKDILRKILCRAPQHRLKASEALDMVSTLLAFHVSSQYPNLRGVVRDQTVPDIPELDEEGVGGSTSQFKSNNNTMKESESKEQEEHRKPQERIESVIKYAGELKEPSQNTLLATKSPAQIKLLNTKGLRSAMIRLGATSVSSVNALSFYYGRKSSY